MNKAELVNAINATGNYTARTNAAAALDDVLAAITNGVSNDGKVQIVGFGTFTKKTRAARTGRNPQTGATIQINESTTVGFKAGKTLKDSL
jgi:DNA-binding protein HU-beta